MRMIFLYTLFVILIITQSCNKDGGITCFDILPSPPYSSPVWHPNGQILGFNRLPLKSVVPDASICSGYSYSYYEDSVGFWTINKDGTNLKRQTSFQLLTPAWSPDGKWIAFSNGGTIYKMAFNGNSFDTAHIITLTNNAAKNFYPAWNATGDSIFFDSNKSAPIGTSFYAIWKMHSDGSGQSLITKDLNKGGREPYFVNSNQLLFKQYVGEHLQIFSMNTNGDNVTQITFDTLNIDEPANSNYNSIKECIRFYNNKIYYESNGIYAINTDGSGIKKLCSNSQQFFSISSNSTIAYVNFDGTTLNKTMGTVWLMDAEGNNKKQLTYNYIP